MMTETPPDRDCPICGRDVEGRDHLRVHLMCNHRKSELTDALLDRLEVAASA